ncbi:uncharacterized protein LOC124932579 [Impatiens glandulifera]|uniref:uncharacterized protein LOC124932579 n=1 Tax=Impatiens glandulifera TaxID=253017 RepID=UPI001FB15D86|nr:uncharacterized protein LOC124932579 [Impatiens glandulifera]
MDSFWSCNVQFEKANAMFRYQRRKTIATLFRLVEMILFLVAASSFSSQIPATINVSSEYFRRFFGTILCPQVIFVVGNVIVIVLFLKSGFLSNSDSNCTDFCKEYARINDKNESFIDEQRKQSIFEVKMNVNMMNSKYKERKIEGADGEKRLVRQTTQLRGSSSSTDYCRKVKYPEDEMSNEEFRRTVEAFIARQQRFLRE